MASGKGESNESPRRVNAAFRQRRALELRKAGATYSAIAQQLGYRNHAGAVRAVKSALKKTLQEPADDVRELEAARLDALLLGIWQQATTGNLEALDRALKIMARRAALLGLDAPREEKAEVTVVGEPITLIEVVRTGPARFVAATKGTEGNGGNEQRTEPT